MFWTNLSLVGENLQDAAFGDSFEYCYCLFARQYYSEDQPVTGPSVKHILKHIKHSTLKVTQVPDSDFGPSLKGKVINDGTPPPRLKHKIILNSPTKDEACWSYRFKHYFIRVWVFSVT